MVITKSKPVSTCEICRGTRKPETRQHCHYRGHASNRVGTVPFVVGITLSMERSNVAMLGHISTNPPIPISNFDKANLISTSMAQNENQKIALQLPNGLGITGSSSPRRPINPNPSGHSGIVVFSGGSAANNLVDVFETVREANQGRLSYVIPISDNGGSSSELIRVFGGPGLKPFNSRGGGPSRRQLANARQALAM